MADKHPNSKERESLANRMIVKPFWKVAAWWGMRRLTGTLQSTFEAYRETLTHFDTFSPLVALTIDDGLCRGGPTTSLTRHVLEVLKQYEATATFFVCTDYLQDQRDDVEMLLQNGHELGNHMQADLPFHYHRLDRQEFQRQLCAANLVLHELEQTHQREGQEPKKRQRWFRAPQGILTTEMKQALSNQNMKHVLGDCYCDDWKFAQDMDGTSDQNKCRAVMKDVAELMLSQADKGSIAIFHMPEIGFREGTLYALEYFLQGMQERGWKCRSLSDVQEQLENDIIERGEWLS
jgi:peptidoglycan-N-acetylglucosamine deacetylase